MAKIVGPLFSEAARGAYGPRLVFSRRASGQQVRIQKAQADIITAARTTQRALYTTAVAAWNALSDSEKEVYRIRARGMSGYNLFIKENITPAPTPPTPTPIDGRLLLHFNGEQDGVLFPDSSAAAHGNATVNGGVITDQASKKWGTAAGKWSSNGDYLTYPDSTDWDIFGSNTDDWTTETWFKYNGAAGAVDFLINQYEDDNNRWYLLMLSGKITFRMHTNSANPTINCADAGLINDQSWHHIAAIKVKNKYACYLDGAQINYATSDSTDTFAGILHIGAYGGGTFFTKGHFDELCIQRSNFYNANPTAELSDTIDVPTQEYT